MIYTAPILALQIVPTVYLACPNFTDIDHLPYASLGITPITSTQLPARRVKDHWMVLTRDPWVVVTSKPYQNVVPYTPHYTVDPVAKNHVEGLLQCLEFQIY